MVHNSQVFLPAYQKDITAGLFFPAFFIYFFFFLQIYQYGRAKFLLAGAGSSIPFSEPQKPLPSAGGRAGRACSPCSRGPLAQGRGTVLGAHSSPAPSALGPRAAGPHQRGGGGCSSQQLFPPSSLFVPGASLSPAPISGSWHKLKTNLAPVSAFAASFTSPDYFYGLLTKRERVCARGASHRSLENAK